MELPNRKLERPLPAGRESPRPLPDRTGRDEMPVSGHPIPGPDRERPDTMDHEVETSAERVRHHLRRPLAGSRNLLMTTAGNTVPVTDPRRKEQPQGGAKSSQHSGAKSTCHSQRAMYGALVPGKGAAQRDQELAERADRARCRLVESLGR